MYILVPIALPALFAESFLLVQDLRFRLFVNLFIGCLLFMGLLHALIVYLNQRNIIFTI